MYSTHGEESPSEGAATEPQMSFREDYVFIRDGDKFIYGKPLYTNDKTMDATTTEGTQSIENEEESETVDSERVQLRRLEAQTDVQSSTVTSGSTSDHQAVGYIRSPADMNDDDSFPA